MNIAMKISPSPSFFSQPISSSPLLPPLSHSSTPLRRGDWMKAGRQRPGAGRRDGGQLAAARGGAAGWISPSPSSLNPSPPPLSHSSPHLRRGAAGWRPTGGGPVQAGGMGG
uniref:Uncharacterized protein n=1 Tax=Oryza sativa subsp. japonica TaxID=39947 RepID=Q6ZDU4_ORYSJ|nr:hypothetical protein [Oryza sativa Japonica Group]